MPPVELFTVGTVVATDVIPGISELVFCGVVPVIRVSSGPDVAALTDDIGIRVGRVLGVGLVVAVEGIGVNVVNVLVNGIVVLVVVGKGVVWDVVGVVGAIEAVVTAVVGMVVRGSVVTIVVGFVVVGGVVTTVVPAVVKVLVGAVVVGVGGTVVGAVVTVGREDVAGGGVVTVVPGVVVCVVVAGFVTGTRIIFGSTVVSPGLIWICSLHGRYPSTFSSTILIPTRIFSTINAPLWGIFP